MFPRHPGLFVSWLHPYAFLQSSTHLETWKTTSHSFLDFQVYHCFFLSLSNVTTISSGEQIHTKLLMRSDWPVGKAILQPLRFNCNLSVILHRQCWCLELEVRIFWVISLMADGALSVWWLIHETFGSRRDLKASSTRADWNTYRLRLVKSQWHFLRALL